MRKFTTVAFAALTATAITLTGQGIANASTIGTNVCNTTTTGVTNCVQLNQVSASTASDNVSDSATAVSQSVANARNIIATHFSFNETTATRAHQCFYDTGLNGGNWIGHPGYTYQRDSRMHICADAKSPTGYIKIGGGYDNQDCHNPVIPDHKPKKVRAPRVVTGFRFVMYAATKFYAKAYSTSSSHGSASAHASSHNSDNSCIASADATEYSTGYAYASASAYGSTVSSAIANAKGNLVKVEVQQSTHSTAEGYAKTYASTKASGTASAQASCTPSQPAPTPSFSCTGLSATPNGPAGTLNYTFSVSAQVSNTTVSGSQFTVLSAGNVISTPSSSTLTVGYSFPNVGSYTVEGQVITASGTTPISSTCTTAVTITAPTPAKPTVSATTLNDLEQGQYSQNFCVNVSLPNGDAGKVQFNTLYGSFKTVVSPTDPSISSINVSGVNRYCVVYYAPQDGTASVDLTEKVSLDLVDTVTNVTADTYKVPDFQIKVPASHP